MADKNIIPSSHIYAFLLLINPCNVLNDWYTDDNIPYSVGKNQCDLGTKLQNISVKLLT